MFESKHVFETCFVQAHSSCTILHLLYSNHMKVLYNINCSDKKRKCVREILAHLGCTGVKAPNGVCVIVVVKGWFPVWFIKATVSRKSEIQFSAIMIEEQVII